MSVRLQSLGYRAASRRELIAQVPVDLLCDIIYEMIAERLEGEQRETFDLDLQAITEGTMDERARKKKLAANAIQEEFLRKQKEAANAEH